MHVYEHTLMFKHPSYHPLSYLLILFRVPALQELVETVMASKSSSLTVAAAFHFMMSLIINA